MELSLLICIFVNLMTSYENHQLNNFFILEYFYLLQPQTLEDITVDPVEDDIEIVNEEATSDAFAVGLSLVFFLSYVLHRDKLLEYYQ